MNNIQGEIDEQIKELKITSLDISFNEIADMYKEGELIINPDYQRTFRWDIEKQSRFIESLLLEMPIPPIYAIEIEDGKYELIDGLQRISSYLCFRNIMKKDNVSEEIESTSCLSEDEYDQFDEYNTTIDNGFALCGCDIVSDLNGLTFEELPMNLKIRAKRCFVRMEVLRKGINPTLKYHMFKRLNTGGEKLSPQEIRNCSIRLIDSKFINFINELAKNQDFCETLQYVSLSMRAKRYYEELVLRFFALKNSYDSFTHNIDTFLTTYMEQVAMADSMGEPIFDYSKEKNIFERTFQYLNNTLGKSAFSTYKANSKSLSGFNVYQYEAITYGMQMFLDELTNGDLTDEAFKMKIDEAKKNSDYKTYTVGGGKNSPGVLKNRCDFIIKKLGEK